MPHDLPVTWHRAQTVSPQVHRRSRRTRGRASGWLCMWSFWVSSAVPQNSSVNDNDPTQAAWDALF